MLPYLLPLWSPCLLLLTDVKRTDSPRLPYWMFKMYFFFWMDILNIEQCVCTIFSPSTKLMQLYCVWNACIPSFVLMNVYFTVSWRNCSLSCTFNSSVFRKTKPKTESVYCLNSRGDYDGRSSMSEVRFNVYDTPWDNMNMHWHGLKQRVLCSMVNRLGREAVRLPPAVASLALGMADNFLLPWYIIRFLIVWRAVCVTVDINIRGIFWNWRSHNSFHSNSFTAWDLRKAEGIFCVRRSNSVWETSCEANSRSAGQEIRVLWNPKAHHHFHKIPPLASVLSQMNAVPTLLPYFQDPF
jgi:hypothetical protein